MPDVDHHGPGLRASSPVTRPGRPAATTTMSARRDVGGEITGLRVADGHRRVVADEHERDRHPDDVRSADHDGLPARDRDVVAMEHLDRGVRGRRQEALVAEPEQTGIQGMDPVDVLGRVDRVDDGAEPDRGRERLLDDDPGDRRIVVQLPDRTDRPGLELGAPSGVGRDVIGRDVVLLDLDQPATDPGGLARPQDLTEVDGRRRVATDEDDDQRRGVHRWPRRRPVDVVLDRGPDLRRDRRTEQEPSLVLGHGVSDPSEGSGSRATPDATVSRVRVGQRRRSRRADARPRSVIVAANASSPTTAG